MINQCVQNEVLTPGQWQVSPSGHLKRQTTCRDEMTSVEVVVVSWGTGLAITEPESAQAMKTAMAETRMFE